MVTAKKAIVYEFILYKFTILFIWHSFLNIYTPYSDFLIEKMILYGIINSNLNLKTPK